MSNTLLTNASLWGQGNNWSFTGIHRQLQGISDHIWQSLDVIFLPNMQFECCMILQNTRDRNFDIFATSGESTAWVLLWKTRSRSIGVRVCPVAQIQLFQHFIWSACVDYGCILERSFGSSAPASYAWKWRRWGIFPSPPTFFDDPDVLFGPCGPPGPPEPPAPPGPPPGWPPDPSPAGERDRVGPGKNARERVPLRPSQPEPQLVPIPMSDDDDDQPPQEERSRRRSRSGERTYPHEQAPQVPQGQPMDTPEADEISDEEFPEMNHSLPSVEPQPSAEQRGRSRTDERSRSRERTPPRSSPHDPDESSATVDPQNRVSDRWRSHQEREDSRRSGPQQQRHDSSQQRGKKTVAERQSSESPKVKKHNSTDSEKDDEEPQKEPRTSSNTQPIGPILPSYSGDGDSEYSEEYSAQSQDSGRTVPYPDLYVLTNEEHWTMTLATHKYAAAVGSFRFSITKDGEQQDVCNLITMPSVQRSLYLNEATNDCEFKKKESKFVMELMVKQETCWNAVWPPAEELQEQEPKWDLVRKRKPKKLEDTTNNLLKQNILIQILGW